MDSPRRNGPNYQRFGVSTSINGAESVDTPPQPQSSTKRWLRDLWASRHSRIELLLAYWFIACIILLMITQQSWFGARVDGSKPVFLTCQDRRWDLVDACTLNGWSGSAIAGLAPECLRPNSRKCGPLGLGCLPFNASEWLSIHCYQSCIDEPVFGSVFYRADSIICAAAAHAGVIGSSGGCAFMKMVGERPHYESSLNNSILSQAYNFTFPSSFIFKPAADSRACTNLESTFILTALVLVLISLVLFRPPKIFIFTKMLMIGFWIVLVALSPTMSPSDRLASLTRDLPILMAGGAFVFFVAGEHALYNPVTSSLPNIFFYLIPFMAGLSIKSIFNWIPTAVDAAAALAFIIVFATMVIFLLVYHLWLMCKSSCLKRMAFTMSYLAVGLFYLILWILLQPEYTLHPHHHTVALFLIPLTRWRNRPVVSITQALLVGTFVNGIALDGWSGDFIYSYPDVKNMSAVTCGVATNSSLSLNWNGNPGSALGLALYMNYQEVQRKPSSLLSSNLTFQVPGLQAHTHYQFSVSAVYDKGKLGVPSPIIICSTT